MKCVDFAQIVRYREGELSPEQGAAVEAHLARCERCAALRDEVAAMVAHVAPEPGDVSAAEPDNVFIDGVVRGDEIDGLARVGDKLYGLSVLGKVYEIDEAARVVTEIDDLSALFPEQGLRLRGATEITVPPG